MPNENDFMVARDILGEGYRQRSSKYRLVERLPPGKSALEHLKEKNPREYERIISWAEQHARIFLENIVETRELTPGQFRAFKKLGGW